MPYVNGSWILYAAINRQPLVNRLHDSSEPTEWTCTGGPPTPYVFSIQAAQPHVQGGTKGNPPEVLHGVQNPLYPSWLLSLASFKEIKASILFMDRKELHFCQLHTHCEWQNVLQLWKYLKGMLPGPMPLCFVYQSDAFSRMCASCKDKVSMYRNASEPI